MRRINRFFVFVCTFLLFVTSGCGFIPLSSDMFGQDEQELGLDEVLSNAQNEMNSLPGYSLLTRGQVTQTIQKNGNREEGNFSFEFDQKFNNQPQALYSVQKEQYQNGTTTNKEMYIVDGMTYIKNDANWVKAPNRTEKIVLSQNPPDFLRFASEANGQGITLEKEPGAYVIRLDQTAGKGFLQQFYNEAKGGLQLQGIYLTDQDFQTTRFSQTIWIDDQTFKLKKMDTDLAYSVQYNGRSVTNESRLQVNYQGDYNNRIQVPESVKNSVGY